MKVWHGCMLLVILHLYFEEKINISLYNYRTVIGNDLYLHICFIITFYFIFC